LLLAIVALAATVPAAAQKPAPPAARDAAFGEVVHVRTGFVRVTLPAGAPPLRVEDVEVVWRRQPQRVLRVIGGADGPIEVGIAVDRSASMHAAFEPMRKAALELVDRVVSDNDRLFAMSFSNEVRLLAEGRGEAARVIATLPTSPESGNRPTAFFVALADALDQFENAEERAALLVVSDGCDTGRGQETSNSVARRARDLAIPIFLLLPGRGDCRNTTCIEAAGGEWQCHAEPPPPHGPPFQSRGQYFPADLTSGGEPGDSATRMRARFSTLIREAGGGDFVVRDPEDWERALNEIFERLGRQWTVVFEPSSPDLTSDEVVVYAKLNGKRKKLG
jgi:hypothetical protein